jgi:transcriptional regulator with XRE-family HTH domain
MRGSKKLKAWRLKNGLSQTEVAKRIGTEQGTLGAWERNERRPDVRFAVAVEKLTKGKVSAGDWSGMTVKEAEAAAKALRSLLPSSAAAE